MEQITTIDRVGRLLIPEEFRARYHLDRGSRVRIAEESGRLVLEPVDEPGVLVEENGLLLIDAHLSDQPIDHRQVREERLDTLLR